MRIMKPDRMNSGMAEGPEAGGPTYSAPMLIPFPFLLLLSFLTFVSCSRPLRVEDVVAWNRRNQSDPRMNNVLDLISPP